MSLAMYCFWCVRIEVTLKGSSEYIFRDNMIASAWKYIIVIG